MMNISDQAFASLYEELEEAFSAAIILGKYKKAFQFASLIRAMEQSSLVPHNVDDENGGEIIH